MAKKISKAVASQVIFQFKIVLMDTEPAIWRRVQAPDMTLDQFHACIQTAMGWTNSHLHQFELDGVRYGDPELLYEGFEDDQEVNNSLKVKLSKLFTKHKKGYRFQYEYDFGDGWAHEITYEGVVEPEAKVKYPRCIDGARACPPEDCGGAFGYANLLEVLKDKKHPEYKAMREWAGLLKPEAFSAEKATQAMHKGLTDWREDE